MKTKTDSPIPQVVGLARQVSREKPSIKKSLSDEELLADLSGQKGWEVLKKIIEQRIEYLEKMIDPLSGNFIIENDPPEIVGFKYLIVSTVISYLDEIKNLPDLAYEGKKIDEGKSGEQD